MPKIETLPDLDNMPVNRNAKLGGHAFFQALIKAGYTPHLVLVRRGNPKPTNPVERARPGQKG